MHYVTKIYRDLPAAHRQPKHGGHCRLIHGHNWTFEITFACARTDECDFVVDIGGLQVVKDWLNDHFDHTLLLNEDDPLRIEFGRQSEFLSVKLVLVPSCSMEGLAQFVFGGVMALLSKHFPDDVSERGLAVKAVTCWEDSKNKAIYQE